VTLYQRFSGERVERGEGMAPGAIIAIIAGCSVLICILAITLFICYNRKYKMFKLSETEERYLKIYELRQGIVRSEH